MATKKRQRKRPATVARRKRQTSSPALPGPVLSLDTVTEQPTIKIDGKLYELKHPAAIGLVDFQAIVRECAAVEGFEQREDLSDEEAAQVAGTLDRLCRRLLDAPDQIQLRLNDWHRMGIVRAFSALQTTPATDTGSEA